MRSIKDLKKEVNGLSPDKKNLVNRIYKISVMNSQLVIPDSMKGWVGKRFGSVNAVKNQKVVRINNLISGEGALWNELRAKRPVDVTGNNDFNKLINKKNDPFCNPLRSTPADIFGRVKGESCITCSNIARYDGMHGLIIFDEHNPLKFSKENISDYLDTGLKWAKKANKVDKDAIYFFFMWNCLWKAGASIIHGHAQLLLAREMHYSKIEHFRKIAEEYKKNYGSDYFEDLFNIHNWLGLGIKSKNVKILSYLTPVKNDEVLIIGDSVNEIKGPVYKVLKCYRDKLGIKSFNLSVYLKPIVKVKGWEDFPVIVRIVNRGNLDDNTSDIGCVELHAGENVIQGNPFRVIEEVKKNF